jgi:glycosyltransferase involved in cell wall biosynthesis
MNISSRLRDIGVLNLEDISFMDTQQKTINVSAERGIEFINEPSDVDVIINNCLPVDYSYDAKYVIGFSYWETTKLPISWIENLNKCNEVWTVSRWAKQVFINSGVTVPVYDFNLGVDTEIFDIKDDIKNSSVFTFMHIGSPSTRKNTQLVFDAFRKIFKKDENYKLIIKSSGPPDARIFHDKSIVGSIYNLTNVKVIDYYLSDIELSALFNKVDCFVYPTRGEGWGMAPFQAIAKGVPTICTNETACTEFANLSIPLAAELSSENLFGIYQTGEWADPKIDDVCDKMLYVVNNYQECVDKTLDGAKFIHENYSWDKVATDYKNRLLEIVSYYE